MSYSVITISPFDKRAKKLAAKYPSLKKELLTLINELQENPKAGTPIGNSCYKIRLAISSKGKGKSGGARVITNVYVLNKTVYLLSIYDKSEKENISDAELETLLAYIKP